MSEQSPETPYLARPIHESYGYMLGTPDGEVSKIRGCHGNETALAEAAGLGLWIGTAILEKFPKATVDDLHDGLGYSLPYLKVEPEVANVVYESAMDIFQELGAKE